MTRLVVLVLLASACGEDPPPPATIVLTLVEKRQFRASNDTSWKFERAGSVAEVRLSFYEESLIVQAWDPVEREYQLAAEFLTLGHIDLVRDFYPDPYGLPPPPDPPPPPAECDARCLCVYDRVVWFEADEAAVDFGTDLLGGDPGTLISPDGAGVEFVEQEVCDTEAARAMAVEP